MKYSLPSSNKRSAIPTGIWTYLMGISQHWPKLESYSIPSIALGERTTGDRMQGLPAYRGGAVAIPQFDRRRWELRKEELPARRGRCQAWYSSFGQWERTTDKSSGD
ncbi:unnamed protein product [Linum trigynum]